MTEGHRGNFMKFYRRVICVLQNVSFVESLATPLDPTGSSRMVYFTTWCTPCYLHNVGVHPDTCTVNNLPVYITLCVQYCLSRAPYYSSTHDMFHCYAISPSIVAQRPGMQNKLNIRKLASFPFHLFSCFEKQKYAVLSKNPFPVT